MSSKALLAAKSVPLMSCGGGCQNLCATKCQLACLYACQASCLTTCEGACTTSCQTACLSQQQQSYLTEEDAVLFDVAYPCGSCTVYEEGLGESVEPALVLAE